MFCVADFPIFHSTINARTANSPNAWSRSSGVGRLAFSGCQTFVLCFTSWRRIACFDSVSRESLSVWPCRPRGESLLIAADLPSKPLLRTRTKFERCDVVANVENRIARRRRPDGRRHCVRRMFRPLGTDRKSRSVRSGAGPTRQKRPPLSGSRRLQYRPIHFLLRELPIEVFGIVKLLQFGRRSVRGSSGR